MSKSKRKAAFKLLQRGKQYPGVHGKVVDFVDHGWGEGMLLSTSGSWTRPRFAGGWLLI